jgi:hypothetical protein
VARNSFAPARAALHTSNSRHAPTSPGCLATMAHTSERKVAPSTAQLARSLVVALMGCLGCDGVSEASSRVKGSEISTVSHAVKRRADRDAKVRLVKRMHGMSLRFAYD